MTAPVGKGLYVRNPYNYPDDDPALYAAEMGCRFVAFFHDKTPSDDPIVRAHNLGLDTYLYSHGPSTHWLPSNWERELYDQTERALRLGMRGFIADVENAPVWREHRNQVQPLAEALRSAAFTLPSVGFTSFPTWPYWDDIAEIAAGAGLWGSPQIYGIVTPGAPQALYNRMQPWREGFAEMIPSIAAWRRTPVEQWDYMQIFNAEQGAILWQSTDLPEPGSERFQVLQEWQPEGIPWTRPGRDLTARNLFATTAVSAVRAMRGQLV